MSMLGLRPCHGSHCLLGEAQVPITRCSTSLCSPSRPPGCFSHPRPLPRLFPLLGIYPSESSSDVTPFTKSSPFLPSQQQLNTPCSLLLVLVNPYHRLHEANVGILFYYCFNTWTAINMPLINFKLGIICYFSTIQVSCYSLKAYN